MYSTPLHLAAYYNKAGVVKLLLAKKGININATDLMGYTPLHWGAFNGNDVIIQLFLAEKEINTNVKANDGRTPLDIASDNEFESTAKLLQHALEIQLFKILDFIEDGKQKRLRLLPYKATPLWRRRK